jgi:hypothetical protein
MHALKCGPASSPPAPGGLGHALDSQIAPAQTRAWKDLGEPSANLWWHRSPFPAASLIFGGLKSMACHPRRLMLALTIAAAALVPISGAASGFTLTAGSPRLTDRTLITMPVTVSCPAIDPTVATFIFNETVTVNAQQPAGRSFATASGTAFGSQTSSLIFPCDGSSTVLTVSMLANPSGPPFHGGPAIFTLSASVTAGFEAFPGCGCGSVTLNESAVAGPMQLQLH